MEGSTVKTMKRYLRRGRGYDILRFALILLLGSGLTGVALADIEIVAESGTQAPGEAAGVNFTTHFKSPVIGGGGHVAFGSRLTGPGISNSNNDVIFGGIPRFLRKVAQENQAAPGTGAGVLFRNVPLNLGGMIRYIVSDSGAIAFLARLDGPGVDATNDDGVWAEMGGSLTLVAREGQLLPDGSTLQRLLDFYFTDAGVVVYLNADPGGSEIWFYRNGVLTSVAAEGDSAAGFIDCTLARIDRPVGSPSGKIAFRGGLIADVGGANCPVTIYVVDGGTMTPAVSSGDPAPNLPVGTIFGTFSSATVFDPKINEHGDLIVHTGLTVPGEAGQRASSWIVRTNGDLELLALEGETMPSDPGIDISQLAFEGVSNTTGRSAMKANLSTGFGILAGNPRASFNYDPTTNVGAIALTEVARTGQQATGQPVGTTYSSLDEPFINNSGHVAFMGFLNIGGDCIWSGPASSLTLAACEGQSVDVVDPLSGPRVETPGSFLPLTGVPAPDGAGSGDGLPSPFSDTGQVVAKTTFLTIATHAIVISPPSPVDTDSDGIPDYIEGGNDIDGDGTANFEDLDSDGDGEGDAVDNCPAVANPAQGPAPFDQLVLAANAERFEWTVAIPFMAVRGSFITQTDIGSFVVDETDTGFGRDLPVPELPTVGTGFWYLLRPDCDAGSWISGGPNELTGRDAALP